MTDREPLCTLDRGDRGQAHTLEAVSASIVLLASVVFALQITAVTPLTASTASQHIENQQAGVAEGLLDAAAHNGTLKPTILLWNESGARPYRTIEGGTYPMGGPPTQLGVTLNETFVQRGIAFDMSYVFVTTRGSVRTRPVVDLGVPSDHAVRVTRSVVLYDSDHLYYPNGTKQNTTLAESTTYFAGDSYDGPVYNVVQVEITIWRM